MAGYDYFSGMSNNAVQAYEEGKKPLSQITAEDLREAGIGLSKAFAIWLAKNGHWKPCEWHHSGGSWYNMVDFYDPTDLLDFDSKKLDELIQQYKESKQKPVTIKQYKVVGKYAEWGGTRKHPRITGYVEFTGVLIGDWIYIDGGGRKKASGNHIELRYIKDEK